MDRLVDILTMPSMDCYTRVWCVVCMMCVGRYVCEYMHVCVQMCMWKGDCISTGKQAHWFHHIFKEVHDSSKGLGTIYLEKWNQKLHLLIGKQEY